jgi:CRP/FNR family transcriptional regulator
MERISTDSKAKLNILRKNPYFGGLNEELTETLARELSLFRYQPGEIVCWQGEACRGLYIIQTGSVKLFKISQKGRELIIRVLAEGATFNEVPVFDHGGNAVNVATLEKSEIWMIPKIIIHQILMENPDFAQAVILNLSQNLRRLVSMVEELSFHQVTNRLARLIAQLPEEQLHGDSNARLTQAQLAARLGTVREVVARSLRELERSGAIRVRSSKIHIIDANVLADWAHES